MNYPVKIVAMGRYLPERVVTNAEVEALCGLERGAIDRSAAGVVTRHWVERGETCSGMGAKAAAEALRNAEMTTDDIDLIISAGGGPEQAIPDGGALVQRAMGLEDSGIPSFAVHGTCLGFLHGLEVASNLLTTGRYRNILLVNADISSLGLNFAETYSAPLFGDAAAACILTRTPDDEASVVESTRFETYSRGASFTEIRGGGTKHHPNDPETKPEDNLFHMDPGAVFKLATRRFPRFMAAFDEEVFRTGASTVDWVVPHQASMKAIQVLERLGIPKEKTVVTLDTLGNCISASLPSSLYEAIMDGRIQRGDRVFLVGTGAGLSLGAAILRF